MVKQAAASALITLRIDEAAEEILMQLVCIGDSDRIFRDLAWVEGLDLKDVCRRVLMSGSLSEKGQLELGRLCGQYDEIRRRNPHSPPSAVSPAERARSEPHVASSPRNLAALSDGGSRRARRTAASAIG